eukprot:SAG11_NODE_33882_length_275_cov_0.500000_2_plen_50_part_01
MEPDALVGSISRAQFVLLLGELEQPCRNWFVLLRRKVYRALAAPCHRFEV